MNGRTPTLWFTTATLCAIALACTSGTGEDTWIEATDTQSATEEPAPDFDAAWLDCDGETLRVGFSYSGLEPPRLDPELWLRETGGGSGKSETHSVSLISESTDPMGFEMERVLEEAGGLSGSTPDQSTALRCDAEFLDTTTVLFRVLYDDGSAFCGGFGHNPGSFSIISGSESLTCQDLSDRLTVSITP